MDPKEKIIGAVGILIVLIALLALTDTIVTQVETEVTAASGWTFVGHAGAATLLSLVPFVYVAAILISCAVAMFELARS